MIYVNELYKNKIYNILIFAYFFFIFFHKHHIFEKFSYIKISELIFLILFFFYIIFDSKKILNRIDNFDLLLLTWPTLNLFQFFLNSGNYYGFLSSIYVFSIYLIFKNLLLDIGQNKIIKLFIFCLVFYSSISIIGWSLAQLKIYFNLVEYKDGWPIYLFERYRSIGFMPTPNMLFFYLSFGFLIIQNFTFKFKKLKLSILFLGIFFTFSKSLILFLLLFLMPFIVYYKNKHLNKIYFLTLIILILIFNFLTNFVIHSKNSSFLNNLDHKDYIDRSNKPILETNNFTINKSTYLQIKIKSFQIIKENFFLGIGYDNFKNYNVEGHEFVFGYKPHSSVLGLIVENGIFALIIFSTIIYQSLKINLRQKNYYFISVITFLIFEAINMDVHYFKIIWIFFPFLFYSKWNKKIIKI